MLYRASLLSFTFLLTACAVGKDYETPALNVDSVWNILAEPDATKIELQNAEEYKNTPWWELFKDETLTLLIKRAEANNNELRQAAARIEEARANELGTTARLLPEIDGSSSATRHTLGGFEKDKLENTKGYNARGRWDIDLFGRNRRRDEAASYNTEAATADHARIRLQVLADVGKNYVRLRGLQKQYELTFRNLELQRKTLSVTNAQREEAMVSDLDVLRAKAQTGNTRSRLPLIKSQIDETINRLAVLVADRPASLQPLLEETTPIPVIPKQIVASTPVNIIGNRPDVKVAERKLAEATALSGAAFAEFFPNLSLDGMWGKSKSDFFGNLTPWNAGANLVMPLLDFGRIRAGVDAADAREQQAFFNFQQTVLLAVEDTENAFSAYLNEIERRQILVDVAAQQTKAADIAREQYFAGIIPQLDLLDAERSALAAENEIVSSEVQTAQNLITLYATLGKMEGPAEDKKD